MALARSTDPQTSHDAAAQVEEPHRSNLQALIHLAIQTAPNGMTDEGLVALFSHRASPSGVRTRRKELERMGFVENSGEVATTRYGRDAVIWKARA